MRGRRIDFQAEMVIEWSGHPAMGWDGAMERPLGGDDLKPQHPASDSLEIGLVFETFDTYPRRPDAPPDAHVEYEPMATVEILEEAISSLGHRPRRLGPPHALLAPSLLEPGKAPDAVLNIAEGYGSRNREAWVPNLLEMAGVPCLGSDGLTLSLTLDKAWANRMAGAGGLPVAPQSCFAHQKDAARGELPAPFPLFVKPRWEGTSKGIRRTSRVEDRPALVAEVARIVRDYRQPALVEAFLPGAEFTVTVVGHDPPRALPILQRALEKQSQIGLHALEESPGNAADSVLEYSLPGKLENALEGDLADLALAAFDLFACLDFARVDFRLDAMGKPFFLEINPLPTFAVDGSFGILAELAGQSPEVLLAEVLDSGLHRLGLGGGGGQPSRPESPVRRGR